jgi:hypothetical protein
LSDSNLTLFGFPVVITDAVPQGEILFGRLPTWQEVVLYGSLEAAIEARKEQWAKVKDIPIEEN